MHACMQSCSHAPGAEAPRTPPATRIAAAGPAAKAGVTRTTDASCRGHTSTCCTQQHEEESKSPLQARRGISCCCAIHWRAHGVPRATFS